MTETVAAWTNSAAALDSLNVVLVISLLSISMRLILRGYFIELLVAVRCEANPVTEVQFTGHVIGFARFKSSRRLDPNEIATGFRIYLGWLCEKVIYRALFFDLELGWFPSLELVSLMMQSMFSWLPNVSERQSWFESS